MTSDTPRQKITVRLEADTYRDLRDVCAQNGLTIAACLQGAAEQLVAEWVAHKKAPIDIWASNSTRKQWLRRVRRTVMDRRDRFEQDPVSHGDSHRRP